MKLQMRITKMKYSQFQKGRHNLTEVPLICHYVAKMSSSEHLSELAKILPTAAVQLGLY